MPFSKTNTVRKFLIFSFLGATSIAVISGAQAETIDRETLMEQAPVTCVPAAAAHYKVDEGDVTLKERGKVKYKSSLRGVAVPITVKLNGRAQDRTCLAMTNGKFKFFAK